MLREASFREEEGKGRIAVKRLPPLSPRTHPSVRFRKTVEEVGREGERAKLQIRFRHS